ncbi:WD repeat-containing protein 34 [Blyttiomyces sp. JEL0837]|nr:WD repeat-containing protein 34 [Blyttiomyces sp. JEL0837]
MATTFDVGRVRSTLDTPGRLSSAGGRLSSGGTANRPIGSAAFNYPGRAQSSKPADDIGSTFPPVDFKDYTDPEEAVDIFSTWKNTSAVKKERGCQTAPVYVEDAEVQSYKVYDEGVQTDPEPTSIFRLLKNVNHESLAAFLDRAESLMSRELLRNIRSTAFEGYSVSWEEEVHEVTCLHALSHIHREPDLICTDVCWNKTGTVVAVAYGRLDHSTWCSHKGHLCTWSLTLRDMNPSIATFAVETTTCLMSIAFHPELPHLIAGGTYQGEVIVWNMNEKDNPIHAASKMNELTHQEAVAKVLWIPTNRYGQYEIMSVGNEGKILIWSLDNKLAKPKSGSLLSTANIPRQVRNPDAKSYALDMPLGCTSLTVSNENRSEYIVGTETGFVFRCSINHSTLFDNAKKGDALDRLANPIQSAYKPHVGGPVSCLSFCPYHRNLFLSCGADGKARLFSKLQLKDLITWSPTARAASLTSVQWSPHKPSVFAMACEDGSIFMYNLARNPAVPFLTIPASEKAGISTTAFAFNPKRREQLATADAKGFTRIWRLPTEVYDTDLKDDKVIQGLGNVAKEG